MTCRHGKLDGCAVCEEIASLKGQLSMRAYDCIVREWWAGTLSIHHGDRRFVVSGKDLEDARAKAIEFAEQTAKMTRKYTGFTCMRVTSIKLPIEVPKP